MKVLHVIGSLEDGGAEAVLYGLIRETPHIDHVVAPLIGRGKYVQLLEKQGVEVRPLGLELGVIPIFQSLRRLRSLCDETKPPVIQAWMYQAAIASILASRGKAGTKIYMGIHNTAVSRHHNKFPTYACIRSLRALHASFAGIIYCSESARKAHEDIGYPLRKGNVITNGICTRTFQPSLESRREFRMSFGISDSTHLFGMVARVHPQKNHGALLNAIGALKNRTRKPFKAVLVGRGTDTDYNLQRAIAESNLSDFILALGPRDDIPALMSAIDTLVLPSAFGEAFPMVLAEAMSCGTPCIATDVGDSAAMVGDTGAIVPPGDNEALSDSMLRRLNSPPGRTAYNDEARHRALERFSITAMAQTYEQIWTDAAERRNANKWR